MENVCASDSGHGAMISVSVRVRVRAGSGHGDTAPKNKCILLKQRRYLHVIGGLFIV